MIRGSITTKDILLHPITVISLFGLCSYVKLILKCFSTQTHCFIEILYK